MPLAHTPKKAMGGVDHRSPQSGTDKREARASPTIEAQLTNVRRSIGEWEGGVGDQKPSTSTTKPRSPSRPETATLAPLKQKPRAAPQTVRRKSTEFAGAAPSSETESVRVTDRVKEGRALLVKIKTYLGESRNLKSDLKTGITVGVEKLYQLLKEEASNTAPETKNGPEDKSVETRETANNRPKTETEELQRLRKLEKMLEEQKELLTQNKEDMKTLKKNLKQRNDTEAQVGDQKRKLEELVDEVRGLRLTTENTGQKVSSLHEAMPTYAEVLAKTNSTQIPPKTRTQHSIIVSSNVEKDTSEEVMSKVREALGATANGFQITRAQKVKNQKVVLSCATKEELKKVSDKISAKNLAVEQAKNKDPLIIIKNLLAFNKDEDIVASLRTQNGSILGQMSDEEFRAAVKYRRRARNPHENHVVLQVSPQIWKRLTEAGRVHIDLQQVAVSDQSPLIQCTRCLGYGHGRKLCKEPADLCSYCAGPHLRAECTSYLTGETPNCRNCRLAKNPETGHNAFDSDCPIRKRWDAIARASVAYHC